MHKIKVGSAQVSSIPTWNIPKDIPLIPLIPGQFSSKNQF